jgi:threonine aldolase
MSTSLLDFRSDTVTRPTPGMRAAMAEAEVGDDVFGEDPTVERLQQRVAQLLGKEASLFVPSGTMSNAIAVMLHCRPGDELICEAGAHIIVYEQGGYARLAGTSAHTVPGCHGVIHAEQLVDAIRADNVHYPRTRLLALENTHNRGGGTIQPYATVEGLCQWAHEHRLRTHLDGARLLNAAVATGIAAARWAQHFDTVGICFSKGLGAPVGSAIAGPRSLIEEARRLRKVLGGGMRQVGMLAAAALYALDHHVDRLADDHAHAQRLAAGIGRIPGLRLEPAHVDTNLVFFTVDASLGTAPQFCARLKDRGLLVSPFSGTRLRAATHLDVNAQDVDRALEILAATAAENAQPPGER